MRLSAISVHDSSPVRLFDVGELSDVVVIAGPNGVGKTRLLDHIVGYLRGGNVAAGISGSIESTCDEERSSWGGKKSLDLSSIDDMALFRATIQISRRRQNWKSSLVNFESDRTIQNLQPLSFTWEIADPDEEQVSWESTFGYMRDRFQDTVHSMFKKIEVQKQSIANRAIELRRQGRDQMNLTFEDPMTPFKDVFSLLLAPKELVDPSAKVQRLEYMVEGQVREFATLSSGEREVVNIAFDFLLRKPQDCIVFFDEPELHLHPELSYRLIQTLQQIGQRNQFVFSTHSPDVITSSLDRSVVFLSPPSHEAGGVAWRNQAIPVSETDNTNQALKLLGQSIGIIVLGKRIVLIEGEQSSLDKQIYGSIIKSRFPGVVLVSSGGKHVIESFSTVYDAVLSQSIWGVEFFMLCDGDTAPLSAPRQVDLAQQSGRLRILPRYHVENYFLDENVWCEVFSSLVDDDSPLRSPTGVRQILRESAQTLVSYATALAVSARIRQAAGSVSIMPKGCHGKNLEELLELLSAKVSDEEQRIVDTLRSEDIKASTQGYFDGLTDSLNSDSDLWKNVIPGKPLLAAFAGRSGIPLPILKTAYLNAGIASIHDPFAELIQIFDTFANA